MRTSLDARPHARHRAVQPMTSAAFREARRQLGLTQRQLAHNLDTAPTTIRKWEATEDKSTSRRPNPVACRVMRWMLDGFRPPE